MNAPELIADYACACGEGPLWHPVERRLYWLDIPSGRMFRYDPEANRHEECRRGSPIGGATLQDDGSLLLFLERGVLVAWRGGVERTVRNEVPEDGVTRFNDVISDPAGRVFCGTMPAADGTPGFLCRLETDGRLARLLGGIGCTNGMGFTPDRRGLYYTDSSKREIYLFDYDERTGDLANQHVFVRLPEGDIPDGMTVDADGFVWSAIWGGGCVARFDPCGREVLRIGIPAKLCSSVIFGGDGLRDMYLTSAGGDDKAANGPGAGGLFRVRDAGRGVPEFVSRIGL